MNKIENIDLGKLELFKMNMTKFMMTYQFALAEIDTKIDILKQEFQYTHEYNPIEHVTSRIKTPESIFKKMQRKNYELSLSSIKKNIRDIAGLRITCSFVSDIYQLSNMLKNQQDIEVLEIKDYIKNPKPNGYKSLHLILTVPVFMSNRTEKVCVEVQIRTIAMDFWASLEHKIFYKYDKKVPQELFNELKEAADTVNKLDEKMERIHIEMKNTKESEMPIHPLNTILVNNEVFHIPKDFLKNLSQ